MKRYEIEKWVDLFQKWDRNLRPINILQEITIGYNSTVYLISINGKQYAAKIYDERYNGANICHEERDRLKKARKIIPDAVPGPLFCSNYTENQFQRDILVMERSPGVPLTKNLFNGRIFKELVTILKNLHGTKVKIRQYIDEIERIDACTITVLRFLKEDEAIARKQAATHLSALRDYYLEKKQIFNLRKTIIHGDLWWDNILVNNGKVTLVDWLESSEQDYCRDLAQMKIGTLNEVLDAKKSQYFFEKILSTYKEVFEDKTIFERMRYYLPLMYLEEAFYLPFKFFPWEIKYREDASSFRKRFANYYERSEWFFKHEQEKLES